MALQKFNLKEQKPLFGQLVIGPPGSGKTTYCHKISEFFKQIERKACVVNLDPANENMGYDPEIDIMKLITVQDVMDHHNLGPNGALMYCVEYLEVNFDWLLDQIKSSNSNYFVFDCPGKILFLDHNKLWLINKFSRSSGTLHTSSLDEKHLWKAGEVGVPFVHCAFGGFTLLLWATQVHFNANSFLEYHAADGVASR